MKTWSSLAFVIQILFELRTEAEEIVEHRKLFVAKIEM
jgi:hypothetical protein